jgi:cytochrome c peroxidase
MIDHDRRVADVQTNYDPVHSNGAFNHFFATANPKFTAVDDGSGLPTIKHANLQPFRVRNIFTDFKRHDLGTAFHERNFDGTITTLFMTTPLWGGGATAPYGHDGRSATLEDVILRHGNEAQNARDHFAQLTDADKSDVLAFLATLQLFAPPDTASNLDPMDPSNPNFPLQGHGSIKLSVLFNTPSDKE